MGLLVYALLQASHPTISQLRETLQSDWWKIIENMENSGLQRVSALSGLMAVHGAEHVSVSVRIPVLPSYPTDSQIVIIHML